MTLWLVETGLRSTVVLAAGLGVAALLQRRSAAARHWVLATTLACVASLPVIALLVPTWSTAPLVRVPAAVHADAAPASLARPTFDVTLDVGVPAAPSAGPVAPWSLASGAIVSAWLIGLVVAATRLAVGLGRLARARTCASPVTDPAWVADCAAIRQRLGVARDVALRQLDRATPVVTWGWRRPVVLLPSEARTWTAERRHVVLAHELAHVSRLDWPVQVAGAVLGAVQWCNPAMWLVQRQLRHESERAADDAVLALGIVPHVYASHLVDLARDHARAPSPSIPAPAMARPPSLEGRVHAMLDTTTNRRPLSRAIRIAAVVALATVTVPIAAARLQPPLFAVRGAVTDRTGRAVPNVTVSVRNTATQANYEVRSDGTGHYEFVGLPSAAYVMTARQLGFRDYSATLTIDADATHAIAMAVGQLHESVSVWASPASAPPSDPVADVLRAEERETRRRRALERHAQTEATCASGPPIELGGNIKPPVKVVHVNPVYPAQSRAAGQSGTVTMRATIDAEGVVREILDLKGQSADLEAAAADAVRQWQFTPTLLNCERIEVEMRVTVTFDAAK